MKKKWQTLFCGKKIVQSSNVQGKTLYFFCHHYKEPSGTYLMNVRSSLKVAMIFVAFFYAPILVLVAEIHEKYDQRISVQYAFCVIVLEYTYLHKNAYVKSMFPGLCYCS